MVAGSRLHWLSSEAALLNSGTSSELQPSLLRVWFSFSPPVKASRLLSALLQVSLNVWSDHMVHIWFEKRSPNDEEQGHMACNCTKKCSVLTVTVFRREEQKNKERS